MLNILILNFKWKTHPLFYQNFIPRIYQLKFILLILTSTLLLRPLHLPATSPLTTAIINYHSKINYGSNPCMIATVDPRPNLPVDFDYDFTGKMDTIGRIVRRKDFGVCSVEGAVRMVMLFVSVT